jgi:hypothetical protein
VTGHPEDEPRTASGKRRRWLLSLAPVFESRLQGERSRAWDVEDELIAVAFLGDVTIDLSQPKSAPAKIDIDAYAIFRDVDVLVAEGDHVELFGGVLRGNLRNNVPSVPENRRKRVIRIRGHTVLGDVTARIAEEHRQVR